MERSKPSGPTEHARIREKKRNDAERAGQAVFEGRFADAQAALRSGEFETSAKLTLQALRCLELERDRELVQSECDRGDTFNASGATPTYSPGVEVDEIESGVFDDNRGINDDATRVSFAFNLTVSDGRVERFKTGWNGATWDCTNRWVGEKECFIHYEDPLNRSKALASAQRELRRLEAVATRLAAKNLANDRKHLWLQKQCRLRAMGQQVTEFNKLLDDRNRNNGKALCNAATALADVSVGPGYEFNGQEGTQIYICGNSFRRHSSSAEVSHCASGYQECRSDDRRRKKNAKSNDHAASAPVQFDCKMLELVSDSMRNANHHRALSVLRSIAKKARGYPVAAMLYETTNAVSGKKTTRRENFLPIFDYMELITVAQVIIDGITLFRKRGYTQEKKDWLSGQKRKRA